MLAIKLRPVGKRKQISYRVVVMEKKSKLVGRYVEDLGYFNPHSDKLNLNQPRVEYWIGVGAQPTDTVHNLLVGAKIVTGAKRQVHSRKLGKKATAAKAAGEKASADKAAAAEAPAEAVAKTEEPAAETASEQAPAA